MNLGKLGVWFFLDTLNSSQSAETAKKIEKLGYSALWLPEAVGKNPMVLASWLLANTEKLVVATGIANIYNREPGATLSAQHTLAEQSDGRFLLGLGVSHKPLVEGVRGLEYGPPVKTMRDYLSKMEASPYTGIASSEKPTTLIAALGPKMLELAAEKTDGAHPYFTSPEHTEFARKILGKDKKLCVEQKVMLEPDLPKARDLARPTAKIYQGLPNYRNNWLRMGLSEEDINSLSDRFMDTTFALGTQTQIEKRLQEHFDAVSYTHLTLPTKRIV